MSAVWSEEAKFQRWLDVELAATDAWAQLGQISREAERRSVATRPSTW
jgi:adenylosuccinate lyase